MRRLWGEGLRDEGTMGWPQLEREVVSTEFAGDQVLPTAGLAEVLFGKHPRVHRQARSGSFPLSS